MSQRTTPVTLSVAPISAGHVLGGRFEIKGVLGEGGTGIVYDAFRYGEADDQGEKVPVALKVIHGHLLTDKQIRGRFTREASILRRLQGKNLCPILDFGELDDPKSEARLLFIALPKIDGPPLDQMLREQGPLPIPRVVDFASQICNALASAHAQGVIHRDLKPANVILEKGERAIVVDFGMAKIVTGAGTESTALTQQNMVFGTPEYMAPEQARGDELDARCDIYALGVMLYEMLAGKVPFSGHSPLHILTAHLTEKPKPPTERAPERGITPALEAVVMHALAKDPADRYPTAISLKEALARALGEGEDVKRVAPSRVAGSLPAAPRPPGVSDTSLEHAPTMPAPEPTPESLKRPTPNPSSAPPPSSTPTSRPSSQRRASSPSRRPEDPSRKKWLLVWALAIIIGLGLGAWLSLRS